MIIIMQKQKFMLPVIIMLAFCNMPIAKGQQKVSLPETGFIENKGQIKDQNGNTPSDVRFVFSGQNFIFILKDGGFSYELLQYDSRQSISEADGSPISLVNNENEFAAPETKVTM